MDKKLTLKLDGAVIERAKHYAEKNHDSVSGLVERYLKTLTEMSESTNLNKSSTIVELSGLIKLPANYDERDDYYGSKAAK